MKKENSMQNYQDGVQDCSNSIGKLVNTLEELHPLDFRLAFGLTHEEAAKLLGLEPQTMRAYSKNRPSKRVKRLAANLAQRLYSESHELVNSQFITHPR